VIPHDGGDVGIHVKIYPEFEMVNEGNSKGNEN